MPFVPLRIGETFQSSVRWGCAPAGGGGASRPAETWAYSCLRLEADVAYALTLVSDRRRENDGLGTVRQLLLIGSVQRGVNPAVVRSPRTVRGLGIVLPALQHIPESRLASSAINLNEAAFECKRTRRPAGPSFS